MPPAIMPHRVTNFLRTSSGGLVHPKKKSPKAVVTRVSPTSSSASSPYASDHEDGHAHHHPHAVLDITEAIMTKSKFSLPFRRSSGSTAVSAPAAIDCVLESPPIVFHGTAQESTGALVSGQMSLNIKEKEGMDIEGFGAELVLHVRQKQPHQKDCPECQHQYTELKKWVFVTQPVHLAYGVHQYPFSVLLEGHLPATVETQLLSISYDLRAEVTPSPSNNPAVPTIHPIKFERTLQVSRAIPEPELPHHSVRVFPPTNIKVGARYATVIHPTGLNEISLRFDGLVEKNACTGMLDVWKLKKIAWKLEQTVKTIAPACPRHPAVVDNASAADENNEEPQPKGTERISRRILGERSIHSGWTSDYGPGKDGTAEMDFKYSMNFCKDSNHNTRPACSGRTNDGTVISHALHFELVVSKEYAPEGRPNQSAPTGTGRILRMTYNVTVTDHPGLGVSWDNEAPPMYDDVPPSPPEYPEEEQPISYDVLEVLDAERTTPTASRRGSAT